MKKETSYEVKRELYFKKVGFGTEDDLYVFKDKRITPWDEVVIQGICDKKEIDDFHNNKYIKQEIRYFFTKKMNTIILTELIYKKIGTRFFIG